MTERYFEGTNHRGERLISCMFFEPDKDYGGEVVSNVEVLMLTDGSHYHFTSVIEYENFVFNTRMIDEIDYKALGIMATLSNEIYSSYNRNKKIKNREFRKVLIDSLKTHLTEIERKLDD